VRGPVKKILNAITVPVKKITPAITLGNNVLNDRSLKSEIKERNEAIANNP
jgi:hypothetical protein